ncbi:MAG TPA: FHA domain-containing protein, partial [Myxococcaceae bacterium]
MDLDEETFRLKHEGPPGGFRLFALYEDRPQSLVLPERGRVTIGRSAEVEFRLEDHAVSRRHLTLHLEGGVRLEDLGSANGTRVRGRQLSP